MTGPAGSDLFADAPALTLETGDTVTCAPTDMTTKTKEAGEYPRGSATQTAWWTFTAPTTGTYNFDTLLSPSSADTYLEVFSGDSVDDLTQLAYSDDISGSARSEISALLLNAGATYHLRISPYSNGDADSITLRASLVEALTPGPPEEGQGSDWFDFATEIAYNSSSVLTPSAGLHLEGGEPGSGISRTAWWTFTAPATETVGLNLFGTVHPTDPGATMVNVYTGTTLTDLVLVATGTTSPAYATWQDDQPHGYLTDMDFEATAGTTYYVQVGLTSSFDDVEYQLQLGKRVYSTGPWVHPASYDIEVPFHSAWFRGTSSGPAGGMISRSDSSFSGGSLGALQGAFAAETAALNAAEHLEAEGAIELGFDSHNDHLELSQGGYSTGFTWYSVAYLNAPLLGPSTSWLTQTPDYAESAVGYEWDPPESDGLAEVAQGTLQRIVIAATGWPMTSYTFSIGFLLNVDDYDAPLTWDLQNRHVLGPFTTASPIPSHEVPTSYQVIDVDLDLTGLGIMDNQGRMVLLNGLDQDHDWDTFVDGTESYAGDGWLAFLYPNADPDAATAVKLTLHPPGYRYVYKTIASVETGVDVLMQRETLTWGAT